MKTMETSSVIGWLNNQGMLDAARNFESIFGSMERVERNSIEIFLTLYYGVYADEVFKDMRYHVSTFLEFDLSSSLN
jgi:hypothetical protein